MMLVMLHAIITGTMRTTVTLDDDLQAAVQRIAKRRGVSFRDMLNTLIRNGLEHTTRKPSLTPFRIVARDWGKPAMSVRLERTSELLDTLEGPARR
jgi:predicted DNA-binding ribbon-helix-helix protein